MIGLERSVRSRPAGFRTHGLVCLASALLMVVSTHQSEWVGDGFLGNIATDPTRMAQGIMTGIGFLGAGVIFKDGLSVRGLTTAASVWITSALGILYGIGFFLPAVLGTVATLGTLALFHFIEKYVPNEYYAELRIRFSATDAPNEAEVIALLREQGFKAGSLSYRLDEKEGWFEYGMVIQSRNIRHPTELAVALRGDGRVHEFHLMPRGE